MKNEAKAVRNNIVKTINLTLDTYIKNKTTLTPAELLTLAQLRELIDENE